MKISIRSKKGFTLIELLVVIAIISLLSSIVLVNLNNVRQKGKDALLRQEGNQMRTLLEQEYSETGSYIALNNSNIAGWMNVATDCDSSTQFSTLSNYASQSKAICKTVVANASTTWSIAPGGNPYKF